MMPPVIAFSFGLAAVLISFGMLMVYGRRFMARLLLQTLTGERKL